MVQTKSAQVGPVIQIDSREQRPLEITAFAVERATLPVGDYGVRGFSDWDNPAFIVERKALDDLASSLTHGRERFMREMEKMRAFRFRALLIEATELDVATRQYVSAAHPNAILATLDALAVRHGLHVFWCGDPEGAARKLESLVRQFIRGIEKEATLLGLERPDNRARKPVAAISGAEARSRLG